MKVSDITASPPLRILTLLVLYAAALSASLWLAYEFRFDFLVAPEFQRQRVLVLRWLVPMQLILLAGFRQFAPLLSYFSVPDLARLFYALVLGSALAWGLRLQFGIDFAPPKGVILVDFVLSLMSLASARLAFRL